MNEREASEDSGHGSHRPGPSLHAPAALGAPRRGWSDYAAAAICSGLGFGYSPFASGTFGSLPAVAVYVLIEVWAPIEYRTILIAVALAAACAASVALGSWAEHYWGRKDPRRFVLDEIAGFLLTVLLFRGPSLVLTVAWAFVVTRICDIVKPPPGRRCEKLPAGWGILMDDLAASLYAAGILHIVFYLRPQLFGG